MSVVLVAIAVVVVLCVVNLLMIKSCLIVVPMNKVLILSGARRRRLPDGSVVAYRLVFGGARVVKIPVIETAEWMDLTVMMVEFSTGNVYVKGGIPLDVSGVAAVKVSSDERILVNAIERFLGRKREEIAQVALETLVGHVRQAAARLTVEQLRNDPDAFKNAVLQEAEADFARLGLAVDQLRIRDVVVPEGMEPSIRSEASEVAFTEEPIPGPAPGPEPVESPALGEVRDELGRLADPSLARKERDELLDRFAGRQIDLSVTVENVTFTTAFDLPRNYQGGQTVVGKAFGSLSVSVSFPEDRSAEVKACARGTEVSVPVKVVKWDPLFSRLVTLAV